MNYIETMLKVTAILVTILSIAVIVSESAQAHEMTPQEVSVEFVEFTQDIIQAHEESHQPAPVVDHVSNTIDIELRIEDEFLSIGGHL